MSPKRVIMGRAAVIAGFFSSYAYGVEQVGIQAALDRYKVVGVISEESPRKPLAGIAVLQDARTSQTHTLTIGDPLPADPTVSIVSTKAGQVTVSDGKQEFTLHRTETVIDTPASENPDLSSESGGKWEDKVRLLGMPGTLGNDKHLLPETSLGSGGSTLSSADDKFRFPYYKVENTDRDGEGMGDGAVDPFADIETFSKDWQDWEWMPASDLNLSDFTLTEPEAPRILEGSSAGPWWVGEEEARSALPKSEP